MTRVDWLALAFVALTALIGLPQGAHRERAFASPASSSARSSARGSRRSSSPAGRTRLTRRSPGSRAPRSARCCSRRVGGDGRRASLRGALPLPPLRMLDSIGGVVLGVAAGLALVWVAGASALFIPGQTSRCAARRRSRSSSSSSTTSVPPRERAATRSRASTRSRRSPGRSSPVEPPDPALLRSPRRAARGAERRARPRDGLRAAASRAAAGSRAPRLVVTAAHVVAGEDDTVVAAPAPARALPRDGRRVRPQERRRGPARAAGSPAPAAARASRASGDAGGDPRLSRRTVRSTRRARAARLDDGRAERGRVGHGPVARKITALRGARPARQLRRPDGRRVGCGRDDGVRGAARESGRLRRAERHRRASSCARARRAPVSTGDLRAPSRTARARAPADRNGATT